MKILVSGFKPFGENRTNPTQRIISDLQKRSFDGIELHLLLLDVLFGKSGDLLIQEIRESDPDAVISFGLAAKAFEIRLERFAINMDDAVGSDNNGVVRSGEEIAPGNALAYRSNLPLEKIYSSLSNAGLPVSYSNHAGTYVCNHVFYRLRHWSESTGLDLKSGFIHIPQVGACDHDVKGSKPIKYDDLLEAACICIRETALACKES